MSYRFCSVIWLFILTCIAVQGTVTHSQTITGTAPDTSRVIVQPGWNLLSLPLCVNDPRAVVLFPECSSGPYAYEGGYLLEDSILPGLGYWLKFSTADTIEVSGVECYTDQIPVKKGWNLVGSVMFKMPVSLITSIPVGIIHSPFFGYTPGVGYTQVESLDVGHAYWVKVSSDGVLILPPRRPSSVYLLSPPNGASGVTSAPLLIWARTPFATRYRLQVSADSSFRSFILDDSSSGDTSRPIPSALLSCGSAYYWRVDAGNSTGYGPWSEVWKFTTDVQLTGVPVQISPANETLDLYPHISFRWSSVSGAPSYRLQIGTDSLFLSNVQFDDSLLTDTARSACLHYGKHYYWRVAESNNCTHLLWSTVRSFTTVAMPETSGWQYMHLPGQQITAVVAADSQTIYVTTPGSMFKTTNAGACWDTVFLGIGFTKLKIHPTNQNILYGAIGGSIFPPYGIAKTTDAGSTWFLKNTGLRVDWETYVGDIEFDPSHPETLYSGTHGYGLGDLYKSTDGGEHWFSISSNDTLRNGIMTIAVYPEITSTVLVGIMFGGWTAKTIDGGASWKVTAYLTNGALVELKVDTGLRERVYASMSWLENDGTFKVSFDGGWTWQNANDGLPWVSAGDFVIVNQTHELYLNIGDLYYSNNYALTWMRVEDFPVQGGIGRLYMNQQAMKLYVGVDNDGIYVKQLP